MISTSVLVDIRMPTCITGHQLAMHSWISPQADLKEVQSTPKVVHFHERGVTVQPTIHPDLHPKVFFCVSVVSLLFVVGFKKWSDS